MPVGPTLRVVLGQYGELLWGQGFPVLLLVVLLTALVTARTRRLEAQVLGFNRRSLAWEVLSHLALGLGGGFLGSLVFVFLGISVDLNSATIGALWAAVFLLLMFDFRFVCFSYASSLVAVLHLLTGWPDANVAGLMALVAVLHGVEAMLIAISGDRGAVPVTLKGREGPVGGFVLQEVWPVAAIMLMGQTGAAPGAILTPHWWPLIRSNLAVLPGQTLAYALVPIMVVLAYSDVTTTLSPERKVRQSGGLLALYSILLLGLAFQAARSPWLALAAAVWGTAGHELVIFLSRTLEQRRLPIFVSGSDGLLLMDVMRGSIADEIGLKRGDVLVSVNDQPMRERRVMEAVLVQNPLFLRIHVRRGGRDLRFERSGVVTQLGVVIAPGPGDVSYLEIQQGGLLKRMTRWLAGRTRSTQG